MTTPSRIDRATAARMSLQEIGDLLVSYRLLEPGDVPTMDLHEMRMMLAYLAGDAVRELALERKRERRNAFLPASLAEVPPGSNILVLSRADKNHADDEMQQDWCHH